MNLYSEANKYFEEILKEENAKLDENLKKKKLKESTTSRKKLREAVNKPDIPRDSLKNYRYSSKLTDPMGEASTYLSDDNEMVDVCEGTIYYNEDAGIYIIGDTLIGNGEGSTVEEAFKNYIKSVKANLDDDEYYYDFAIDDSNINYDKLNKTNKTMEFSLLCFVSDSEGKLEDMGIDLEDGEEDWELEYWELNDAIKLLAKQLRNQQVTIVGGYPNHIGEQCVIKDFHPLLPADIGVDMRPVKTYSKKELFDMALWLVENEKHRYITYGRDLKLDKEKELLGEDLNSVNI